MDHVAATIARLHEASVPEDVFKTLTGTPAQQLEAVKKQFRALARVIHPDQVEPGQTAAAESAFAKLGQLKSAAEEAIQSGTYGCPGARTPAAPVVVRSSQRAYIIAGALAADDLADRYRCHYDDNQPGLLKVSRHPSDNDLLQAEAAVLRHLRTPDRPEAAGFFPYLPRFIDTFGFREDGTGPRRVANVFTAPPGFYSLAEVRQAYPDGISPKHMAWIWRQLLQALGYVHARGVIHGAVLLPHVHIHPEGHDLMLADWCSAVQDPHRTGAHIPVVSTQYEAWYPPEVLAKQPPMPGTDILMGARCMVAVMGGDPLTGNLPAFVVGQPVPARLRGFLKSCLLIPPYQRPQDAWHLRDEFTQLIEELWGPRQRLLFTMPPR